MRVCAGWGGCRTVKLCGMINNGKCPIVHSEVSSSRHSVAVMSFHPEEMS